jgi:hypothetical protein
LHQFPSKLFIDICGAHFESQLKGFGHLEVKGGAQDNVLEFKFQKVASRTYKVVLKGLGPGEYGFLAPGTTAGLNAASQGKVYTFRIAE